MRVLVAWRRSPLASRSAASTLSRSCFSASWRATCACCLASRCSLARCTPRHLSGTARPCGAGTHPPCWGEERCAASLGLIACSGLACTLKIPCTQVQPVSSSCRRAPCTPCASPARQLWQRLRPMPWSVPALHAAPPAAGRPPPRSSAAGCRRARPGCLLPVLPAEQLQRRPWEPPWRSSQRQAQLQGPCLGAQPAGPLGVSEQPWQLQVGT